MVQSTVTRKKEISNVLEFFTNWFHFFMTAIKHIIVNKVTKNNIGRQPKTDKTCISKLVLLILQHNYTTTCSPKLTTCDIMTSYT